MAPGERIKCILQACPSPRRARCAPAFARLTPPPPPQIQGQATAGAPQYSGPADVVKQLYRQGGIRSVFKGSAITLLRDGSGYAPARTAAAPRCTRARACAAVTDGHVRAQLAGVLWRVRGSEARADAQGRHRQ